MSCSCSTLLHKAGVDVTFVNGIHNKTLAKDDDFIAEGSFNWLSAVRKEGGTHQREERTLVNEGKTAKWDIDKEIAGLDRKITMARSGEIVSTVTLECKGDGKEDKAWFGIGKSLFFFLGLILLTAFTQNDTIISFVMVSSFIGWFIIIINNLVHVTSGPFDNKIREFGPKEVEPDVKKHVPKERELSDVEKIALGVAGSEFIIGSSYFNYTGYKRASDDE